MAGLRLREDSRHMNWSALGFVALLVPLLGRTAEATVVKELSLEEKTKVASVVVHGKVASVASNWAIPGKRIETVVTIEVLEAVKGKAARGQTISFVQGGGKMGEKVHRIEGQSKHVAGEQAIWFLEARPTDGKYVEIGIGIGKYEVRSLNQEPYVMFAPTVAEYVSKTQATREARSMEPERLPDFLSRVRTFAGAKVPMSEPEKFRPLLKAPLHRRVVVPTQKQ